jgi:hypothetical protein
MNKQWISPDNFVVLVAVLVAVSAVLLMDHLGMPQKWHAAIMWTGITFCGVLPVFRKRWLLWSFWASWAICLAIHILGMWIVFGQMLASIKAVGMIYAIPFGFGEGLFLLGILPRLEERLAGLRNSDRARVS